MFKFRTYLLLFVSITSFNQPTWSCTDFRVTAQDNTVLITRSMEFAKDFKSNIRTTVRGKSFDNKTPDGKAALSWKSKYGYVYADGLNIPIAIDGLNEQGLSFGYLYLPNETKYQSIPDGKSARAIPYYHFGDWILGNFANVDEVLAALTDIYVYEQKIPEVGDIIFPLHASIYDATGKGIVVEFVDGQMNIYENKIAVLTNSPTYPWHVENLRNFVNLSPYNPKPVIVNGLTFIATGQGSGMMGLPGDTSPPSRFVKTAVLNKTAIPVKDALEALNLSQHIINNVDIPLGSVRSKENNEELFENTQWVVFKDLSHKKFYYRTYNNMTVRLVSLDSVDFSEKAVELKMPLEGGNPIVDMTKELTGASQATQATPVTPAESSSPANNPAMTNSTPKTPDSNKEANRP